jgi:four helix bundle protein
LRIASGSAAELETQLLLADRLYRARSEESMETLKEVQKMLEAFIRKL